MFVYFKPPYTRENINKQNIKFLHTVTPPNETEQIASEYKIILSVLDHCEKFKIKIEPTRKRKKIRMMKKPFVIPGGKKKPEYISAGQLLDLVKEFRKLVK